MSQEVRINFTANTAGFLSGVRNIQTAIARTTESIQNKTKEWSIDIANATTALRNGARVIQATASWLSAPLREFSRFEDAATRLAPLVGGLEAAKSLCEELRDEAANGTMSFEQLASVAGRLSTVFKNPADVQKWTTIFHNISAGTGLGNHGIRGTIKGPRKIHEFQLPATDWAFFYEKLKSRLAQTVFLAITIGTKKNAKLFAGT